MKNYTDNNNKKQGYWEEKSIGALEDTYISGFYLNGIKNGSWYYNRNGVIVEKLFWKNGVKKWFIRYRKLNRIYVFMRDANYLNQQIHIEEYD